MNCYFENIIYNKGFEWIEDGYIFLNTILFSGKKKNYCLIPDKTSNKSNIIYPLDENHDLYREFSELYPNLENIMEFANRYGNICSEEIAPILNSGTNKPCTYGSYLELWQKNILDMYINVFLLDKVLSKDYNFLDSLLEYKENTIRVLFPIELLPKWYEVVNNNNDTFPKSNFVDIPLRTSFKPIKKANKYYRILLRVNKYQNPRIFNILKEEYENTNSVDIVKYCIINKIHKHKRKIKAIATRTDEGIVYEDYIVPENLIGGMYFQLRNRLSCKQNLYKCKYCNDWFEPTRKDQKFCPSEKKDFNFRLGKYITIPTGKHCRVYFNREKKAETINLYKSEMSIEQISIKLGIEVSRINKWVNQLEQ